ncbi:hypothetical protein PROFUN_03597 [Planoprotostelium fungivorum]|uniref:Uncharacterized protein n=1 Tax=Planoprotostelium fungivorum TaxID=1890364 RepID=A0A2P6MSJ5_9EUKA|nr:hypothetical protein PROFUN_03597 [Planoprotostelium fungivorum]
MNDNNRREPQCEFNIVFPFLPAAPFAAARGLHCQPVHSQLSSSELNVSGMKLIERKVILDSQHTSTELLLAVLEMHYVSVLQAMTIQGTTRADPLRFDTNQQPEIHVHQR